MPCAAVTALFHTTWYALRVVYSPYLVWDFYQAYRAAASEAGTAWHPILCAPVLQVVLCAFYAKWTWDLLKRLRVRSPSKSHQL